MWKNVAPEIGTQRNEMIYNLKRHNPAWKLLILKQGFSACGLSSAELLMTRAVQRARQAAGNIGLRRPKW